MNQVYFIPLCLARLSLRQAFGVIPKAGLGGWSMDNRLWRPDSLGARLILLSTLLFLPVGCVGTPVGPRPGESARTGFFAQTLESDVVHSAGYPDRDCLEYSEQQQGAPRESWTIPGLRRGSDTKPPEASRFLPVPTRPVFEPIVPY
jgi:hypothetical protein